MHIQDCRCGEYSCLRTQMVAEVVQGRGDCRKRNKGLALAEVGSALYLDLVNISLKRLGNRYIKPK